MQIVKLRQFTFRITTSTATLIRIKNLLLILCYSVGSMTTLFYVYSTKTFQRFQHDVDFQIIDCRLQGVKKTHIAY